MARRGRWRGKIAAAVLSEEQGREALAIDGQGRGIDVFGLGQAQAGQEGLGQGLTVAQVGHLAQHLLTDPKSALARHHGSDGFSLVEHLLFLILDELRVQTWQRTKSGAKNRNRPKPVSPLAKGSGERTIGGTDVPQEDVRDWLAEIGPERDELTSEESVNG